MQHENPYQAPAEQGSIPERPPKPELQIPGACLLFLGVLLLGYGALAFWVDPTLPPNNRQLGRLPSIYVMGGGVAVSLLGLILRSFGRGQQSRIKGKQRETSVLGIVLLLAIFGGFFVYVIYFMGK